MTLDPVKLNKLIEAASDPKYGLNLSQEDDYKHSWNSEVARDDSAHGFCLNTHNSFMKIVKRMNDKPDVVIHQEFADLMVYMINNASTIAKYVAVGMQDSIHQAALEDKITASEFLHMIDKFGLDIKP